MALDPYLYIDPATGDFKDARHSALYLSFIAEWVDIFLEPDPPAHSPAKQIEIDAGIDALGELINHNANTYKLACLQIPELEADQSFTTFADERMARLLAVRATVAILYSTNTDNSYSTRSTGVQPQRLYQPEPPTLQRSLHASASSTAIS